VGLSLALCPLSIFCHDTILLSLFSYTTFTKLYLKRIIFFLSFLAILEFELRAVPDSCSTNGAISQALFTFASVILLTVSHIIAYDGMDYDPLTYVSCITGMTGPVHWLRWG
jgi:hypothetical protein